MERRGKGVKNARSHVSEEEEGRRETRVIVRYTEQRERTC
jgi:hypothetical protein